MTQLSDLFDLGLLQEMIDTKMVRRFEHDNGDLVGYDYTQRAQWGRCWNNVTLQSRGLLATADETVIARPFPKFFNLGEMPEDDDARIGLPFTVSEKLDGSLGIHYRWENQDHIATRGSFHSEQANWATEHYRRHYSTMELDPDLTHLFEIIYPTNRIVVDYGDSEAIVFLAALNIETGEQARPYWPLSRRAAHYEVPTGATPADIAGIWHHLDTGDFEGFVITFADGHRLKVKLDEYVRLHRIMSGTSNRTIWEALRAGTDLTCIFDSVPDEFYSWAQTTLNDLRRRFTDAEVDAMNDFEQIRHLADIDRKSFAMAAKDLPTAPVLFALLDGKDYTETI